MRDKTTSASCLPASNKIPSPSVRICLFLLLSTLAWTALADPLGTATGFPVSCKSGELPGTCYDLFVSCPLEEIESQHVMIKVTPPANDPVGTVLFTTGGGGRDEYDQAFAYGGAVVRNVVDAGYTAVQTSFVSGQVGWLTGPGGPRKLACRYATVAAWVHHNIHKGGRTRPFCATGNSGGAAAIAYSLSHYGLGGIFDMVEPTSGPPMGRIDNGCVCSPLHTGTTTCPSERTVSECYDVSTAEAFIDPSYDGDVDSQSSLDKNDVCGHDIESGTASNQALFEADSVASPDASFSYPTTDVHLVLGGLDESAAVPQGLEWENLVTSTKSVECVPDAPHSIPDVPDGASLITDDLTTFCRVQGQTTVKR